MSFRTIELRLHNLSSYKQQVIAEAMANYSQALQFLLDKACHQLDSIKELGLTASGSFNYKAVAKWVSQKVSVELNQFGIEPMKDAIKNDFGSILAGFFSLERMNVNPSFPRLSKHPNGQFKAPTPCLHFCRYSIRRDYCLLYDTQKNRYYAKLYLMNCRNEKRKVMEKVSTSRLIYVSEGHPPFISKGRKEQFILVPLAFGKYQENFLKQAFQKPGILKSARLFERNKEFFLSINIETSQPKIEQALSYLGVYYGNSGSVSFAVIEKSTNVTKDLGVIHIPHKTDLEGGNRITLPNIHQAANKILQVAQKNSSQVLVENPILYKKLGPCSISGLHKNLWVLYQLLDAIDYRLEYAGLPKAVRIRFDFNRMECSECGRVHDFPTTIQGFFICQSCGHAMNIEATAAVSLAKRITKYSGSPLKVDVIADGQNIRFQCKLLNIDLCGPSVEQCCRELWLKLKDFEHNYYGDIRHKLKSSKWKQLYNIAKKIKTAENLFDVIELV